MIEMANTVTLHALMALEMTASNDVVMMTLEEEFVKPRKAF